MLVDCSVLLISGTYTRQKETLTVNIIIFSEAVDAIIFLLSPSCKHCRGRFIL